MPFPISIIPNQRIGIRYTLGIRRTQGDADSDQHHFGLRDSPIPIGD